MTNFNEEKFKKFINENIKNVSEEDIQKILEREKEIREKFEGNSALGKLLNDFKLLISLIKDYIKGEYKEIPWFSIAAIIVALIYVLSPVDFIPDFIPILGYTDDAFMISLVIMMIREDLEKYKEWKIKKELIS